MMQEYFIISGQDTLLTTTASLSALTVAKCHGGIVMSCKNNTVDLIDHLYLNPLNLFIYPFRTAVQSCPSVQDPFQGRYLVTAGNGFDHGSVINFTCTNSLYELRGSANLLCENGQWSGSVPTCERTLEF